jgi:hypothetical protein
MPVIIWGKRRDARDEWGATLFAGVFGEGNGYSLD